MRNTRAIDLAWVCKPRYVCRPKRGESVRALATKSTRVELHRRIGLVPNLCSKFSSRGNGARSHHSQMSAKVPASSPQTVRLSRSVVQRDCYSSIPSLADVLLEDGITARICGHLRLEHVVALAETATIPASQIGKRVLEAQFWTERDPSQEGDCLGDLLCAVTKWLTPADLKAIMINIETTLMQQDEPNGRLFKWFVLLERPRALSRHLGYLVFRSAAVWRPSDLADLFWAFFPADDRYPKFEVDAEQLAIEFVRFCRSARIRGSAGRFELTAAIRAILQVDVDGHDWAPASKAAFVACLLLHGDPAPGFLDPSTLFTPAEVVPMGIQFGLLGGDLDALSRLAEEVEAEMIEAKFDSPAGTVDGDDSVAPGSACTQGASAGEAHLQKLDSGVFYHEWMTLDELHSRYIMWSSGTSFVQASTCFSTGTDHEDSADVLRMPRIKKSYLVEAFTKLEFVGF